MIGYSGYARKLGITRRGSQDGRVYGSYGARTGNWASTGGCPSIDVVVKQLGADLDAADALSVQTVAYKAALDFYTTQTGVMTRPYVFLPIGDECKTLTDEGKKYVVALEADIKAASQAAGTATPDLGSQTISPDFVNPSGVAGGADVTKGLWWKIGLGLAAVGAIVYAPVIKTAFAGTRRRR